MRMVRALMKGRSPVTPGPVPGDYSPNDGSAFFFLRATFAAGFLIAFTVFFARFVFPIIHILS